MSFPFLLCPSYFCIILTEISYRLQGEKVNFAFWLQRASVHYRWESEGDRGGQWPWEDSISSPYSASYWKPNIINMSFRGTLQIQAGASYSCSETFSLSSFYPKSLPMFISVSRSAKHSLQRRFCLFSFSLVFPYIIVFIFSSFHANAEANFIPMM